MSKGYHTLSEWSDDEIDEHSLSIAHEVNARKRIRREGEHQHVSDLFAHQQLTTKSHPYAIFESVVNRVSSGINTIMNSGYKIFKTKSNNLSQTQSRTQSVHSESRSQSIITSRSESRGMSNMYFTNNDTTMQNMSTTSIDNSQIIKIEYELNNSQIVLLSSISTPINPIPSVLSLTPIQTFNNASLNSPPVLCQNDNNSNLAILKCETCGQISSSPARTCRHCGRGIASRNTIGDHNRSFAIPVTQFYSTPQRHHSLPTICSSQTFHSPPYPNVTPQSQRRSIASPKPECITIDDADINKRDSNYNNNGDYHHSEKNNTQNESFINEGIQCDVINNTEPPVINLNSNDANSVETKSDPEQDSNNMIISELNQKKDETQKFINYPQFVLFGTYKCEPKTIEFDSDGIKLTNVSPNNFETRFKYHIMIPYVEMSDFYYCVDHQQPSIFIKPTKESNNKIQNHLYLGQESKNGLKFDINSSNAREHFIIAVFNDHLSNRFVENLKKMMQMNNETVIIKDLPIDKAKLMLHRVREFKPSNDKSFERTIFIQNSNVTKVINPRLQGNRNANRGNPYAVNAARPKLKDNDQTPIRRLSQKNNLLASAVETVIQIDDDDDDTSGLKTDKDDDYQVILTYPQNEENAIQLSANDIKCLNKGEFLNDNIVNFYFRHMFLCNDKIPKDILDRTHIFDTLFFVQLTERRAAKRKTNEESYTFETRYHRKLKNWTKMVDIFAKDFLIIPIIKESHWFLSIVCYAKHVIDANIKQINNDKRPCIIFMDSLGNAPLKKQISTPIREFLTFEWKEKNDTAQDISFKSKIIMKDYFPRVPNQTNSSDCGLFVLEYVEQFLKNPGFIINKIVETPKNNFEDWFPITEAKEKRQLIRAIIFSFIKPDVRNKLQSLVNDDIESDDEINKNETVMEVDNNKLDPDFVGKTVDIRCDTPITRSATKSVPLFIANNPLIMLERLPIDYAHTPITCDNSSEEVIIDNETDVVNVPNVSNE